MIHIVIIAQTAVHSCLELSSVILFLNMIPYGHCNNFLCGNHFEIINLIPPIAIFPSSSIFRTYCSWFELIHILHDSTYVLSILIYKSAVLFSQLTIHFAMTATTLFLLCLVLSNVEHFLKLFSSYYGIFNGIYFNVPSRNNIYYYPTSELCAAPGTPQKILLSC